MREKGEERRWYMRGISFRLRYFWEEGPESVHSVRFFNGDEVTLEWKFEEILREMWEKHDVFLKEKKIWRENVRA